MEIHDQIQNSVRPFFEQDEQIGKMTEISDALRASAEIATPAMEAIVQIEKSSAFKHMDEITSAMSLAESVLSNTSSPAEIMGNAVIKFANYCSNYQVNSGIYDAVSAFEQKMFAFGDTFQKIIDNTSSALMSAFESPMMQWLQSSYETFPNPQ